MPTSLLRAFLSELSEEQYLLASATTEVGTGGDVRSSICALEVADGRFRLEKQAPVISYADAADAILVTARRSAESPESDQVIVLCRPPGLELEQVGEWNALGFRGTCSTGFVLRATGDIDHVLTEPYGDISTRTMLPVAHLLWSSVWLGIASDAVDLARRFVQAEARRRPGTMPAASVRMAETVVLHQQFVDMVRSSLARFEEADADSDRLSSIGFGIGMNALKVSSSTLVVDIVARVHAHLWPGFVPARLAVLPRPPLARCHGCGVDGEQRPDHGQQRPDAPRPPGRVTGMTRDPDLDPDWDGAEPPWAALRAALLADGILLATDVDGIYGRSATYEAVVEAVDRLVLRVGADQDALSVRFPPVMPWSTFQKNGYLESFPDQMGSVHTFRGDERMHAELVHRAESGEDRGPLLETTDIVLCPAVCHPLYPTQSGRMPEGGRRVEVYGYCFRHEPSTDPFRMQAFRQHDYVYLGTPDGARAHRDEWIGRGIEVLSGIGLDVEPVRGQ